MFPLTFFSVEEFYEVLVGAFALCEGGHKMIDILSTITAIVSPIEGRVFHLT